METDNSTCKFKLQAGKLLVEYEGDAAFLIDELPRVVQELVEVAPDDIFVETTNEEPNTAQNVSNVKTQHMSTNTIAGNLNAKSGPDLVMAAIAHLQLVQNRDTATRSDILSEMKKATTYYKATIGSNLSSYLNSLVRGKRINLVAEHTYALTASERSSMETLMATN